MQDNEMKLRPEKPADLPFLRELYATTRVDVIFSGLPDQQKQQFIQMQFDAQRRHYQTHYENAQFLIVEWKGRAIGRFYLARWAKEIRVIDITLSPKNRNQGIGSRLLRSVQSEGRSRRLPVTLHAEKLGDMARYYQKLGFEIVEEKDSHFFMKWTANSSILVNPNAQGLD